jgi:radical SAM-linked protein
MRQRVRLTFRKEGALRFISHHDVMRTFERILRRTGLPLHASAGFNPRPRISFPAALGVGIASEGEVCEFDLDDWVAPDEIRERVAAQMPAGLGLADLEVISPREKGTVARAVYRVTMEGAPLPAPEQVAALLDAEEAVIVRRRGNRAKDINVRPFVRALRHEGDRLVMTIRTTPAGAVRPEEVLRAMGVPDDTIKRHARIVREKVILQ